MVVITVGSQAGLVFAFLSFITSLYFTSGLYLYSGNLQFSKYFQHYYTCVIVYEIQLLPTTS